MIRWPRLKHPEEESPEEFSDSSDDEGTLGKTSRMDTSETTPEEVSQDTGKE